jgi:hypothetical protein
VGHQEGAGEHKEHARWRANPIWSYIVSLRIQLRVQDQLTYKLLHRTRPASDLGNLHMYEKIRR